MKSIRTQNEAVALIYESYNRAKQREINGLKAKKNKQHAQTLLNMVGNPDKGQDIVLVTGSKGKGSTAAFISSLLTQAGYKTGLFTSPHLLSFNERIQIEGKAIPNADFVRLANDVQPFVKQLQRRLRVNEYLGPIAVNLAIAMLYFAENEVDYIILEVGKGGLDDDTNVVSNKWAVITHIFEEHVAELGPTLSHIITHKLGIIKEQTESTVVAKQQPHNDRLIKQRLAKSTATHFGHDYSIEFVKTSLSGATVHINTEKAVYRNVTSRLLGTYQYENIAVAIQTCEKILNKRISRFIVQSWMQALTNPGKCEVLMHNPLVIADAAIHRDSIASMQELISNMRAKHVTAVVGLTVDKDCKGVVEAVSAFCDQLIITHPNERFEQFARDELARYAQSWIKSAYYPSFQEAVSSVLSDSDVILIIGNHSFIGYAKQWFSNHRLIKEKTLNTTM